MEVSGQLHALAALPRGSRPRYPMDRRLGGPQSRSERYGEDKNLALDYIIICYGVNFVVDDYFVVKYFHIAYFGPGFSMAYHIYLLSYSENPVFYSLPIILSAIYMVIFSLSNLTMNIYRFLSSSSQLIIRNNQLCSNQYNLCS
jgi:hypothetical protein